MTPIKGLSERELRVYNALLLHEWMWVENIAKKSELADLDQKQVSGTLTTLRKKGWAKHNEDRIGKGGRLQWKRVEERLIIPQAPHVQHRHTRIKLKEKPNLVNLTALSLQEKVLLAARLLTDVLEDEALSKIDDLRKVLER